MSALDRITLRGFKSIREMDLDLRPLNILIGANGSGKSNFVSLFTLVNKIESGHLQIYVGRSGGADPLLYFGRKTTDEMECRLHFARNGYWFRLAPTAADTVVFAEEGCHFHGRGHDEPYTEGLGSGHTETRLHERARAQPGKIASHVIRHLESWRVYHFHDTSESAKAKQLCDIRDNAALRPDAGNLASFLYFLREAHPDHYRNIVETVRMVAPFFDDFVLRPSPLNQNRIRLEWQEQGEDAYFGPETLSDGTLRFICVATLLLQPRLPSVVLLDEPELGMHPVAITLLASLLKSAATRSQVIACTQSVTLVNQFEPAHILVVERQERQSTFRHLAEGDMRHWLEDYGLGDLWEKNVLGGRPGH